MNNKPVTQPCPKLPHAYVIKNADHHCSLCSLWVCNQIYSNAPGNEYHYMSQNNYLLNSKSMKELGCVAWRWWWPWCWNEQTMSSTLGLFKLWNGVISGQKLDNCPSLENWYCVARNPATQSGLYAQIFRVKSCELYIITEWRLDCWHQSSSLHLGFAKQLDCF